MKISKLPLRIEPGLVALLCAWFYFDPAGTFLPFVCAAALHEAGHLAMLLWLRQPVHSLCLGLQGAVLRTGAAALPGRAARRRGRTGDESGPAAGLLAHAAALCAGQFLPAGL